MLNRILARNLPTQEGFLALALLPGFHLLHVPPQLSPPANRHLPLFPRLGHEQAVQRMAGFVPMW
jgi:hypothetical protein